MAKKLVKVHFLSSGDKLHMLAEDENGNVTLYEDVVLTDMECDFSGSGIVVEKNVSANWERLDGLGHNDP